MSPKYCAHCGAQLYSAEVFFCRCGRPVPALSSESLSLYQTAYPTAPQPQARSSLVVYPAAPQPQAPPSPVAYPVDPQPESQSLHQPAIRAAEPVLDVILMLLKRKGVLGMRAETVNLILTPARLVFVPVSMQEMREAIRQAQADTVAQGRDLFGQVAAQVVWAYVIAECYRSMPVDSVLAQYPGSFCMLNDQVSRIRFKATDSNDGTMRRIRMSVESGGDKYRFDVTHVPGGSVKRRLRRTLPHAVQ